MFDTYDSEFWKTVVDTMQEGLMLVDQNGRIVFVNKAFEEMVGYVNEELVGSSCEVFQCDRCFTARAGGLDKYCALFEEKKVKSSECTFRKKDGQSLHLLKNAALIHDKNGNVVGGVETMVDLSRIQEKEKIIANLRQQLNYHDGFQGIVGNTQVMRQVLDLASSAAQSDAPLVIYGESGTGKEVIASAIHMASPRCEESFIKVNCAALNDNLLESELFGHVKGAFTGADYTRVGRFEAASGGSIFLDEIGDLPLATQTKLLRVLQEKEIERVGDHRPVKIDVRIIAATHKDLQQLIAQGAFREDLYYRIGVIPIYLPPLRERVSDIPQLVDTFIKKIGEKTAKPISGISRTSLDLLMQYSWPGNIRELINTIEYAFVLCPGGQIQVSHLPSHLRHEMSLSTSFPPQPHGDVRKTRRHKLIEALEQSGGNQTEAARILGVSRVTVWKWIKKYGIRFNARVHSD
ncbi:MAG: sigma 54-interacting transcriptional regulator [Desulfobulbaceae bacterium]|nr:sigma 54-interacting transcriptional regulator [Desulfobulbaceae bacterium]